LFFQREIVPRFLNGKFDKAAWNKTNWKNDATRPKPAEEASFDEQ
jgi:hypothetical protein